MLLSLNLTIGEQFYVQISYRRSHPEQKINAESMDINLPTPQSKICLSQHQFSWNSQLFGSIVLRFLYYPNCMKIVENIGKILFCKEWLKMQT